MARVMEVNVRVTGLSTLTAASTNLQALARHMQSLAQSINSIVVPGSGSGGGSGGGSRRGGSTPRGPLAQLAQAQANFQKALRSGIEADIFDAQVALKAAETRVRRARRALNGPSFGDRLSQAILSTRFNLGGQNFGVSPLVGRTLSAAGLSGGSGAAVLGVIAGLTAIVGLTVIALGTFRRALETATSTLADAGRASTLSGGTAGQIAALQALGLPAGDIAGIAKGLRDAMASNPLAAATASRLGLGVQLPRGFGGTNDATGLDSAIQAIANITTETGRLRAAQNLQLDSILPLIEAYRRSKPLLDADAKVRGAVADSGTLRAAEDLQTALGRLQGNFVAVVQALGKPFIADATRVINNLASMIRELAAFLNANPMAIRAFFKPIEEFFALIGRFLVSLPVIGPKFKALFDAFNDPKGQRNSTIDAHTAAMQAHTAAMRQGTFGGGSRTRSAVPNFMRSYYNDMGAIGRWSRLGSGALF